MKHSMLLLAITAVATVLAGGVFFAWSCSVTPGLRLLNDREYFMAFQQMNRAIQNPVFFLVFFGAMVLLPICAWRYYNTPAFAMVAVAACSYVLGVIAVTILGNIPINNTIEAADVSMPAAELKQLRARVETSWNQLNTIRTCCSIVSIIAIIVACLRLGK